MLPTLTQLEQGFNHSSLIQINDDTLKQYGVELWMKRDDLLHPVISGNKWRKLKHILNHALALDCDTLISMGGAYSNHLHALAFTGNALGLNTIGLIRGEPTKQTPTLKNMQDWGMELRFVSRLDYRELRQYKGWQDLPDIRPQQYWLPEGGAQTLALQGIAEMVDEIDMDYQHICLACGTGTTLAGIAKTVPADISVTGFAVFKHAGFLTADVGQLLGEARDNWQINLAYHFGGFAETNTELMAFIQDFQHKTGIPLEPVYTGKMLYGIYDLLKQGYFPAKQRIIALHTGGLQGNRGFGLKMPFLHDETYLPIMRSMIKK